MGVRRYLWLVDMMFVNQEGVTGYVFRYLHLVNLALLGMWHLRLLSQENGLWRNILSTRYESHMVSSMKEVVPPITVLPHLGGN